MLTCRITALTALLLIAISAPAASESLPPGVSIPAASELFKSLRPEHPRLLASAEEFGQLKARVMTDSKLQEWQGRLKREATDLLRAAPSKYEIPDGLRLLATSRRVMGRAYTLGFMYRMDRDRKWVNRAWQELEAAANFPDWNPKHFLDTAEMTHAFAISYDWMYDAWTPAQRDILRQAILSKGFEPARALYAQKRGWTRARHNWNQVCNGGLGMGALALADVEPQVCAEILHGALNSIPLAMVEFAPDGAWNEGPGYWSYATAYNVVFLAGLHSALGTDYGLSNIRGFGLTGLFPLYITGPLNRTFNYADGGDRGIRAAQISWFARRFNQPVLSWYEAQNTSPSAQDLIWYAGPGKSPSAASLPLDRYYRAAEVVVLRSAWEDRNALFTGFKAGDNKANHSHLDLGSFVFDALGVRWAVDMGADNYNLPGYFGGQRWNYYRLRAEGQNTIVINPGAGPDQDPSAATKIVHFQSTPQKAFAVADLTPAYKKHATQVLRGVAMLDRSRLLIQDEIKAESAVDAWWFMHTSADIQLGSDGRSATLSAEGKQCRAELLGPGSWKFQVMDAKLLPGSPHPEKQAENKNVRKLTVHVEGAASASFAVLLTPQDGKQHSALQFQPLSNW